MKTIYSFLTIIAAIILSACSKSESFSVGGVIEGAGMQTVNMTYYAAGGIKRVSQTAVEGRFAMRGNSATPTLCLIEMSDGTPLATVIAENGDKIELKASLESPLLTEVKGNRSSSKLAKWTKENAELLTSGNQDAINRAIAEFVGKNRSDMASTALVTTRFQTPGYESMADSLLTLISTSARPAAIVQNFSAVLATQLNRNAGTAVVPMTFYTRNDSTYFYTPGGHSLSLLAFLSSESAGRDTITSRMRSLRQRYTPRRCDVIEVSLAPDSASWKQSTARDTASWRQAWGPGSIAGSTLTKLSVPRYPFFIVADSTGSQIYRGSSISAAERIITSRLK